MTPIARYWVAAVLLLGSVSAHAGSIVGTATVDGAPAMDAVVYLENPNEPATRNGSAHAVMDQKNLTFVPAVLPIVRGTVVDFTNSDDVQHNVFTPSALAGKFNLGTYGPGDTRSVRFTEPGDVLILCNIHMEMEAHILVLDGPYFSTVARDGGYALREVPAGRYALKIWRGRWLPFTRMVDVTAAGDVTMNVAAGK
jgi:plastocyanin